MQVLSARPREPSFSERLAGGMGKAMDTYSQYKEEQKKEMRTKKQDEQLAKITGMDVSGFSPEMKKAVLVETLKQQGKGKLQGQQQDFLSKILGGTQQEQSPEDMMSEGSDMQNAEQGQMGQKGQIKKQGGFDPTQISDEDIIKAEALGLKGLRESKDAALKKIEGEKKEKRSKFESDRAYHSKISDPVIKSAESVVREAPIKKALISQQRRDIASGNTSGIIPFMVDKLGIEAYRDPESARFKTASKERFVSSVHELGSAGARANQFIEQQLVAAQAALGRSEEANQSVLDLEEFINDAKETRAQIELDLAEKDMEELGYARRDIVSRADKLMKPYIEQRQDEMAYDIRKRHEENLSDEALTKEIVSGNIAKDTPLTIRAARILMIKNNDDVKKAQEEAKKLGFKFPSEKTYQRQ